ncbi:MAG: hypothetical protein ACPGQS_09460, partial [Bradymonadia bacterium]
QILVASDTASPGLLTRIGSEIRRPGYHEVVHDPNTPFSIAAKVTVTRPNYRGEESQEHFPERCLEFQNRCHRQPGFNRCTREARGIKSVSRRENALRRCDRNFKTCTQVCVTVQKAYTVHRLAESCIAEVQMEIYRMTDKEGEAVGKGAGLHLGAPTFNGESRSVLSQKERLPTAVGAEKVCRRAFGNAIAKMGPWFNPSKIQTRLVFADLEPEAYQGALLDLQFGRFERAHTQLDESFAQANELGLHGEDVGWIHHAKAATYFLQNRTEKCREQLQLAARLNPELVESFSERYRMDTPLSCYRQLMQECARVEEK